MTPQIRALMKLAADAPATDPGEGYWKDLDAAFTCGTISAQFEAAQKIREALISLGYDAPAGRPLCPGCSHYASDGSHEPDCTAEADADTAEDED